MKKQKHETEKGRECLHFLCCMLSLTVAHGFWWLMAFRSTINARTPSCCRKKCNWMDRVDHCCDPQGECGTAPSEYTINTWLVTLAQVPTIFWQRRLGHTATKGCPFEPGTQSNMAPPQGSQCYLLTVPGWEPGIGDTEQDGKRSREASELKDMGPAPTAASRCSLSYSGCESLHTDTLVLLSADASIQQRAKFWLPSLSTSMSRDMSRLGHTPKL